MIYLEKEVRRFSFTDTTEHVEFLTELKALAACPKTVVLLQKSMVRPLYFLYLSLRGTQSRLSLLFHLKGLKKEEKNILLDFFLDLLEETYTLPDGTVANEIFIWLCDRKRLDKTQLQMILSSRLLDAYGMTRLKKIKSFPLANLLTLIEFHHAHATKFSVAENQLTFDILYLLYSNVLIEDSAKDVSIFIKEIVPLFIQRFAHRQVGELVLFQSPERFAGWFILWSKYLYRQEEGLAEDDLYYQTDFATIIQYIPEYIWWNDGFRYRNGDEKCYFGSPEFRFLATGGSIRKAPNQHPFTRRMARELVNLPYYLDLGSQQDTYLYLYGKSLGGGHLLCSLLMEFMRHSNDLEALQAELNRWNPIIQKLATEDFEQLYSERAKSLLGYLYHCLRDQQSYRVQGRSLSQILADSDAYYDRITERVQRRAQQEAERLSRIKVFKEIRTDWAGHRTIRPFGISNNQRYRPKLYDYKIIELTNEQQLKNEGQVMKHCVGTYMHRCQNGQCSIWSLRQYINKEWKSLVTMEVGARKVMIQLSARYNAAPQEPHLKLIRDWARREGIGM